MVLHSGNMYLGVRWKRFTYRSRDFQVTCARFALLALHTLIHYFLMLYLFCCSSFSFLFHAHLFVVVSFTAVWEFGL